MKNRIEKTRDLLEVVNNINKTKLQLVNMGGKKYGIYNCDSEKIDGVRQARGTIEYIQGYIFGKYGANSLLY